MLPLTIVGHLNRSWTPHFPNDTYLDPWRRPHPGPRSGGADALELPNSRAAQTEAEGRELAIVALATLNRASLRGLAYAASLGQPVLAVHVSPTEDEAKCFRGYWCAWGDHLRLK